MDEELNASQPVEEAASQEGAGSAEPEQPQYLTRDEGLKLMRLMAEEFGRRGGQSFLDKQGIKERLSAVEKVINSLVSEGVLDQSQASVYRDRARVDLLTEAIAEEGPVHTDQAGAAVDPIQDVARVALEASGLTEADPEYQWLYGQPDPVAWAQTLRKAVAAKKARLTREGATKQTEGKPARPAESGASPAARVARAVELGAGSAPVTDLDTLYKSYERALSSGNRQEADRLYNEIRKLALGG